MSNWLQGVLHGRQLWCAALGHLPSNAVTSKATVDMIPMQSHSMQAKVLPYGNMAACKGDLHETPHSPLPHVPPHTTSWHPEYVHLKTKLLLVDQPVL